MLCVLVAKSLAHIRSAEEKLTLYSNNVDRRLISKRYRTHTEKHQAYMHPFKITSPIRLFPRTHLHLNCLCFHWLNLDQPCPRYPDLVRKGGVRMLYLRAVPIHVGTSVSNTNCSMERRASVQTISPICNCVVSMATTVRPKHDKTDMHAPYHRVLHQDVQSRLNCMCIAPM